jgi:hypothetical protein
MTEPMSGPRSAPDAPQRPAPSASYTYRLLKGASWGILITLRGDFLPAALLLPKATKITDAVWLQIDVGWCPSEEEVGFLRLGLNLVAGDVERTCGGRTPILVRLTGLQYNPTDYQPEGLAAAVAEWAAQACGFPRPEIPVAFDRARRRYVFDFPPPGTVQAGTRSPGKGD